MQKFNDPIENWLSEIRFAPPRFSFAHAAAVVFIIMGVIAYFAPSV